MSTDNMESEQWHKLKAVGHIMGEPTAFLR